MARDSGAPIAAETATVVDLSRFVLDFAAGVAAADARRPVAVNQRSKVPFLPGVGPHTESTAIALVMEELRREHPNRYADFSVSVPYPVLPRQRCDLRVVEEALPRAFLLENVEGLAFSEKNEGLGLLLSKVRDINLRQGTHYEPTFQVVRAADYGVPQLRERFIMVASRDGDAFTFPQPTHGATEARNGQLALRTMASYRTAWDAIGDLDADPNEDLAVRGKWADLLPSIPEGENYLWHTDRGGGMPLFGWRRRYWSFLLKLAKRRPSWTIQAQPGPAIGPFHWKSRLLSSRELCRLQTFPDDVKVTGGRGAVQRQLGNAVPSLLAEVLARAIRAQLLGAKPPAGGPRLLPPDRSPAPKPEPLKPVPRKFHNLRGDHAAHPGTGKGYRAASWSAPSTSG